MRRSASSIGHEAVHVHLKLWHGLTPVFGLSMIAITAGIGLFFVRNWLRRILNSSPANLYK